MMIRRSISWNVAPLARPPVNLTPRLAHARDGEISRRNLLTQVVLPIGLLRAWTEPASALVKGSAPPPKKSKSERGSCKSIDECEAAGEKRSEELFADSEDGENVQKTSKGDRFKDIVIGEGAEVGFGSEVSMKYRVLRLGKRSRDGLSGEASPVFSLGYGEDDDKETDVVTFFVNQGNVVPAIDAGLVGMKQGGRRRINVRPERGWKLPDNTCLKTYTDVTVVPGTQVQENDACFAASLVPTPANYGARRRMLRRYDETLIVDCEVVKVVPYAGQSADRLL